MEGQEISNPPTRATLVAHNFVRVYFDLLRKSPEQAFQLYTHHSSTLSRAEAGPNGAACMAISQAAIHQKILSFGYKDLSVEIDTIDSQESINGSVLAMVVGSLSNQGGPKRSFVQTFFLAPQEVGGYFVYNDMLRYLDGEVHSHEPVVPMQMANGIMADHIPTQEQEVDDIQPSLEHNSGPIHTIIGNSQPCLQHEADGDLRSKHEQVDDSQPSVVEHESMSKHSSHTTHDIEDLQPSLDHQAMNNSTPAYEEEGIARKVLEEKKVHETDEGNAKGVVSSPTEKIHLEVSNPEDVESADLILTQEAPSRKTNLEEESRGVATKSSYASILHARSQVSVHSSIAIAQKALNKSAPAPVSRHTFPSNGQNQNGATKFTLGIGHSVYVKNLPLNISLTRLMEEFKKFGPLKPRGVSLRNQQVGVCFAFIEFMDVSSAQKAIEASPIPIDGRNVYVEVKKSLPLSQKAEATRRVNQGRLSLPYQR